MISKRLAIAVRSFVNRASLWHADTQGESRVFAVKGILVHEVNVQVLRHDVLLLTSVHVGIYRSQLWKVVLLAWSIIASSSLRLLRYDPLVLSHHLIYGLGRRWSVLDVLGACFDQGLLRWFHGQLRLRRDLPLLYLHIRLDLCLLRD